MKILFIGNSHTFVHYVPLKVKEYLKLEEKKADITMLSFPGVGLDYHLKQSQTYFNLLYGDYDVVVLQHNAHPFPGKESLISAGKQFKKLVPEKTRIFLYMTWAKQNDPKGQKIMSEAYEELGEIIKAEVAPVGDIFWEVIDKYNAKLFFEDGEHSSELGACLAAVVIGKTLLGKDIDVDDCYKDALKINELKQDPKLIDLHYENGELELR